MNGLPKDPWNRRLMIRVPIFTREKDLAAAIGTLVEKGNDAVVKNVKLHTLDEGRCLQMLHVRPYDTVAQPIAAIKTQAAAPSGPANPDADPYLRHPMRNARRNSRATQPPRDIFAQRGIISA